jgi:hypothetical protein
MARQDIICARLPPDLHAAVAEMASSAGITTSEWVRDMITRIVYGQPPGIDEGYRQGRALGFRMMHLAFRQAWENAPDTIEAAMPIIQAGNPSYQRNDEEG